ncbi:S8 family serine peptidase [Nocardioides sp. 616]|uniref:S8 family serine peptidase n=1 Tax=Nocardioides sp. 616 TaxID=2268090 RepID=UPI000CE32936|nr:S8 family serine peptidase [Nocardioides sp. 616]
MAPAPRRWVAGSAALVLAGLGSVWLAPAASATDEGENPCDPQIVMATPRSIDTVAEQSAPAVRMHVAQAHRITRGAGVTVAVVDSGVGAGLGMDVVQESVPGFGGPLLSGHGSIVAGLIAGEHGVAPDARILSMRVLDKNDPDVEEGERPVTSTSLAAGLNRLADLHGRIPFRVVNISLTMPLPDPVLKAAIKRLQKRDVVVVAAAGNAPAEESSAYPGTLDSDAEVYPADYPGVLGVSAVGPGGDTDLRPYVRPNKQTDVAAPTLGALSINLNGQKCQVSEEIATSYAAAQVSGVVALLRARFPRETAKQVVARLVRTAEGSDLRPNPWTGAGVVQAADALTHQLAPRRNGRLSRSEAEPRSDATAPPAPVREDVHGPSRHMLLWFALVLGAVVALAFVTRPLLRRLS